MFFYDPIWLLFALPGIVLSLVATILIKAWNNQYQGYESINHLSGVDVVQKIAQKYNLVVRLEINEGVLTDHYDPRNQVISLSQQVAYSTTISAIAVAAHEMGHAIQHQKGSLFMNIRNLLVPALSIGTNLGYFLIIIGLVVASSQLGYLGIILFSAASIFSLLTLPIELDASDKALKILSREQLLYADEMPGAKKVLMAAALTYVAATLQSLGQLLYFVFKVQGLNRNRD